MLVVLAVLGIAAQAEASPVLVLHGTHVSERNERFSGQTELTPPPAGAVATRRERRQTLPKGRATRDALAALLAQGQIDQPTHDARYDTMSRALRAYRALTGTRKTELGAVIATTDAISASGQLIPARLEPVFLTLSRNTEWWTNGTLPSSGQRIIFGGSQVIFQYYPGQGIQLQMLANFGRANSLWSARKRTNLRSLLNELVPLATDRGGFLAWEYFFNFGGGAPPWSSSISQGTAVQAIGRAGRLLNDPALTEVATRALGLFEQAPPLGVRNATPDGAFYVIYTFAPTLLVLNAHLQAVIGLFDFAQLTGDPRAQALYAAGESEARVAVPRYDTGKWSLYSLERESDLSYHDLVTTFLGNLCKRTQEAVYCDAATRFKAYLKVPPVVARNTRRIRAGKSARIGFSLDKVSRVGMTVADARGRTLFSTSAVVYRGQHYYTWRTPAKPGRYKLTLSATDLAGNRARPATRSLRILKARKPSKKRR